MERYATTRRTPRRLLWTLLTGLVLSSNVVHATEPAAPPADEGPRWYGWQIIAVDVPMIVAFDVGLHRGSTALAASAMIGYTAGSPVIHLANQNSGPAIIGAVTHVAVPLGVWALVGVLFARSSPSTSDNTRNLWGATVGGLAATALDAGALAWKAPDNREIVVHTGWSLSPWLPGRNGPIGLSASYVGF